MASGDVEGAIRALGQAATLDPANVAVQLDLATALVRSGAVDAGEAAYRRVIAVRPDHADAKVNLGRIVETRGRTNEAVELYRGALQDQPNHVGALNHFAATLLAHGQFAEAIPVLRQVLAAAPDDLMATANLGLALTETPSFGEGVALYRKAHGLSGDIAYRIRADLAIPPMLATNDEILEFRAGFERRLDALLDTRFSFRDPFAALAKTNFYLAYQGHDDRTLQEKTARFYARACPSLNYVSPEPGVAGVPRRRPIRVGFVSMHLRDHTIGKLFRGLIANLDSAAFEAQVFTPALAGDPVLEYFGRNGVRVLSLPTTLEASRTLIAEQRLDILVFPDIGMDPFTYFLAFARLAPVQLASWGHPVTTGIPTIDGFVSHEICESGDTAGQYTERLVKLPANVAYTFYCRPGRSAFERSRRDFGLPESRILYLCPHALFKLHPDFVAALRAVLLGDPHGTLVLIGNARSEWTEVVRSRLGPVATRDNLVFTGWVSPGDFVALLRLGDVLLDSFHFGGGNTTAEALATGIPVVTLPGAFMRGRFTYAWLRRIAVDDGIATSAEDFVQRALSFGKDRELREAVRQATLAHAPSAYEDIGCVRAFESALTASLELRRS